MNAKYIFFFFFGIPFKGFLCFFYMSRTRVLPDDSYFLYGFFETGGFIGVLFGCFDSAFPDIFLPQIGRKLKLD